MPRKFILTALILSTVAITVTCDDSDDEQDDGHEENPNDTPLALDFDTKTNLVLVLFQDRSRDEMRAVLRRTLDMLDHRPIADRERRFKSYNATANALGQALSGDPM